MVTQAAMYIVFLLLLGALAGWLAVRLIKGHSLGLWGNIGGTLLGQFGVRLLGAVGQFITAALGAIILLSLARLIERK